MVGSLTDDAGRSAEILGHGHHDLPHVGRGLLTAAAPDSRIDAEYCEALEVGCSGAGFPDPFAPRSRDEPAHKAPGEENGTGSSRRGQYVLVDRPAKAKARKVRDTIFKGQRAQVLHFLFIDPHDWLSVKEVAASTGISPATVSETLSELERREWVKTECSGPSKLRKLSARHDMLDAWSQFITTQKPPETERFYVSGSEVEVIMENLDQACRDADVTYAISGEAAAQAYSPYLSHISRITCRMASGRSRNKALEALDARPVSEGWSFAIFTRVMPKSW